MGQADPSETIAQIKTLAKRWLIPPETPEETRAMTCSPGMDGGRESDPRTLLELFAQRPSVMGTQPWTDEPYRDGPMCERISAVTQGTSKRRTKMGYLQDSEKVSQNWAA